MIQLPPELKRHAAAIEKFVLPCVGFALRPEKTPARSRLGGEADLPKGFVWPTRKSRKLDFLLQVSLDELAGFPSATPLPRDGMLSFFYDLKDQPWGFDPRDLDGFKVVYTPAGTPLERRPPPHPKEALSPCSLAFRETLSIPQFGSRDCDRLEKAARFDDPERDAYFELAAGVPLAESDTPDHRLLGHSANVQGDMQLEAQLVMNGLYCGDPSGYQDPRAATLEKTADDWILLLQLDSDEDAGFMWGDLGMLYTWIRRQDLAARAFDRAWMSLQCS